MHLSVGGAYEQEARQILYVNYKISEIFYFTTNYFYFLNILYIFLECILHILKA
jgi:hypothetical protein